MKYILKKTDYDLGPNVLELNSSWVKKKTHLSFKWNHMCKDLWYEIDWKISQWETRRKNKSSTSCESSLTEGNGQYSLASQEAKMQKSTTCFPTVGIIKSKSGEYDDCYVQIGDDCPTLQLWDPGFLFMFRIFPETVFPRFSTLSFKYSDNTKVVMKYCYKEDPRKTGKWAPEFDIPTIIAGTKTSLEDLYEGRLEFVAETEENINYHSIEETSQQHKTCETPSNAFSIMKIKTIGTIETAQERIFEGSFDSRSSVIEEIIDDYANENANSINDTKLVVDCTEKPLSRPEVKIEVASQIPGKLRSKREAVNSDSVAPKIDRDQISEYVSRLKAELTAPRERKYPEELVRKLWYDNDETQPPDPKLIEQVRYYNRIAREKSKQTHMFNPTLSKDPKNLEISTQDSILDSQEHMSSKETQSIINIENLDELQAYADKKRAQKKIERSQNNKNLKKSLIIANLDTPHNVIFGSDEVSLAAQGQNYSKSSKKTSIKDIETIEELQLYADEQRIKKHLESQKIQYAQKPSDFTEAYDSFQSCDHKHNRPATNPDSSLENVSSFRTAIERYTHVTDIDSNKNSDRESVGTLDNAVVLAGTLKSSKEVENLVKIKCTTSSSLIVPLRSALPSLFEHDNVHFRRQKVESLSEFETCEKQSLYSDIMFMEFAGYNPSSFYPYTHHPKNFFANLGGNSYGFNTTLDINHKLRYSFRLRFKEKASAWTCTVSIYVRSLKYRFR